MLRGMKVRARVAAIGGVTAADVPTLKAHAEMDPGVAGLQAFFAAFGVRFDLLYMIRNVCTLGCHRFIS
jgi:hypothetical protein